MRALSIRQPYAELILRGVKTVEYRTRSTSIIGERFYIYAAKAKASVPVWSEDLRVGLPPAWMMELARQVVMIGQDEELPTGVIVGSAIIDQVTQEAGSADGYYHWHLVDVQRLKQYKKPKGHPQPMWFKPF